MTFLSNQELRPLLTSVNPIVDGLEVDRFESLKNSPLEASSIRLRVGKIYQFDDEGTTFNQKAVHEVRGKTEVVLDQGEIAFVTTMEEINLPSDIGGLMFPKSGGLADKGILITNTGHVDPGFGGNLRYAVINMGRKKFVLRQGDTLAKLMLFRLSVPASPCWSEMHDPIGAPSAASMATLGRQFGAFDQRASEIARQVSKDTIYSYGMHTFIWAMGLTAAAFIISILIYTSSFLGKDVALVEKRISLIEERVGRLEPR